LNIGGYVVQVVWNIAAFFIVRPSTFKFCQFIDLLFVLTLISIGIYGAV